MRFPLLALIFAAALGAAGAGAQTRVAPQSRQDLQLSFAPVVQRVAPAVVNVYGARVERRQQYMDDFFRRFFGEGGPGMPRERMQRSLGSGVIIDPSGLVVTNHHVI
jgi:S1-C subfamily serine protease